MILKPMPIIRQRSEISRNERIKLRVLLKEAESRGLPIAEVLRDRLVAKNRKWVKDENGYFPNRQGRKFIPYESQKSFVESPSRFTLLIGGRGSGKSCSGAQKALQKIERGLSGAVLNPTFENFKDSTWPEFRDWIPWSHVVPGHQYRSDVSWEPQKPFKIAFENGATVICKGLHDPNSARGPNINWLWFDEGQTDMTGMAWKIAIASVRVGKNPQAWVTATGRGTYHWMYEFFVEQKFSPEVEKALESLVSDNVFPDNVPLIDWFEGTIFDNKDNLDPLFFASMLASYPEGYLRDQELYGKFADPGGNLGNPEWFRGKIIPERPNEVEQRVRYWDLAASEKKVSGRNKISDPDETVGTLLSWTKNSEENTFCIEDQVSGTWEWVDIKEKIINIAKLDGPFVPIYIEEEPGSGGINQVKQIALDIEKELPGWIVRSHNPRREGGDKVVRANIWFAEASRGKFYMVQGNWNDPFLKQLSSFPNAKHDDKIDSVSGARICCAPVFKWRKTEFIHLGMDIENLV
jgi:predicted phage terminase large subunit-like protein